MRRILAEDRREPEPISFGEALRLFENDARRRMRASTLRDYQYFIRMTKRMIGEERPLASLTSDDLDSVVHRDDIKPATRVGYYRRLSAITTWVVKRGLMIESPPITPPRAERLPPLFLSKKEFGQLVDTLAPNPELRTIVRLAVSTGLRAGELLSLRWIDVRDEFLYVVGKGGHGRMVPIFPAAFEVLANIVHIEEHLFTYGRYRLSHDFKAAVREAKLDERYRFHTLRHTFASWLVQDGVPLSHIQMWMGHSSITVTQRYAHLAPSEAAKEGAETFASWRVL